MPEIQPDSSYLSKRSQLATYFDQTASKTWERLTSDAPVSRIRATVRAGREEMAETLLSMLPEDLNGKLVLDAGCGPGSLSIALAERGADVVAVDISASLIEVAKRRTPAHLKNKIYYRVGDMLSEDTGMVDAVVAMDSLIHYKDSDIVSALGKLTKLSWGPIVFTIAPRTVPLTLMHLAGKAFPKSDRSPAIIPVAPLALVRRAEGVLAGCKLSVGKRIARGFYISQAMEVRP